MVIYWRISAAIVLVLAFAAVSARRMTPGGPAHRGDAKTASASVGWAGYNNGILGGNVVGAALTIVILWRRHPLAQEFSGWDGRRGRVT